MGKLRIVKLNEEIDRALPQKAERDGVSAEVRAHFERHFGSVDLGRATGADNESIDSDLAKEYAADQQG